MKCSHSYKTGDQCKANAVLDGYCVRHHHIYGPLHDAAAALKKITDAQKAAQKKLEQTRYERRLMREALNTPEAKEATEKAQQRREAERVEKRRHESTLSSMRRETDAIRKHAAKLRALFGSSGYSEMMMNSRTALSRAGECGSPAESEHFMALGEQWLALAKETRLASRDGGPLDIPKKKTSPYAGY